MVFQGVLVFGAGLLAGLLAAAAARVPPCADVPAAERERARHEQRCEGQAPIIEAGAGKSARAARAPVPDLRGRVFDRGDARLARFVVSVDYRPSARQRDWVLEQRPQPPAMLTLGGELRVVLSDGTLVRVPNVRGGFARALALLHRAGLEWSSPGGSTGAVVGQTPVAGSEVQRGSAVALRIAPGRLALAPESTRPQVTPTPPTPAATPPAAAPARSSPAPAARDAPAAAPIPDVAGMIFDAARERLAGFNVQRVHRAGVEPGGTVIGQSPAAGSTLAPGATVRLVLSDGSLVRVPRVAGLTVAEARQRLAAGELRVAVSDVASDAPVGTVLSQRPADGEIAARGSTVRVGVSSGAAAGRRVPVPNVVGAPFERAQSQLTRFRIERSERAARAPVGTVLEQVPAPGTPLEPGAEVALIVSSGGVPETIEVPNVVAQPADAADNALAEFRVERETVPGSEPAGRILAQEPAAGSSAAPGSTVRVRVSDGSLAAVPALTQQRLADARSAAQASGLTLDAAADASDRALVVEQQPPAGSTVARGSAIHVVLQSPGLVLDPRLAGAWQRAERAVRAAPPLVWALAALALLLLALALSLTRRRRPAAPLAPDAMVEPVLVAPTVDAEASSASAAAPSEALPAPVVVAAPAQWIAQARFEIDPARTAARGATPRGPEIGLAARLDGGALAAREIAAALDERTEPTSEESR
jgi:beta-lactam-binding protein with PASTA domain